MNVYAVLPLFIVFVILISGCVSDSDQITGELTATDNISVETHAVPEEQEEPSEQTQQEPQNGEPIEGDVIINEIMYDPVNDSYGEWI